MEAPASNPFPFKKADIGPNDPFSDSPPLGSRIIDIIRGNMVYGYNGKYNPSLAPQPGRTM